MSIQTLLKPETKNEDWANLYVNNITIGDGNKNAPRFQSLIYGGAVGGDFTDAYLRANAPINATGTLTNPVSTTIQQLAPFDGKIVQVSYITTTADSTTIMSYGVYPFFDTLPLTGQRGVIQLNKTITAGDLITIGFLGSTLTAGHNPGFSNFNFLCVSD